MIYPYLVGALNSGETGSPGRESSAPNPPVPPAFSTQPTLAPDPVSIGNTLTLTEGIAGPDATLTIESFTLDGVDKSGELSGLTWDTTGEAAGAISYQVRATNSGGFVLSDVITGTLTATTTATTLDATQMALGAPSASVVQINIFSVPAGTTDFEYRLNEGAWNSLGAATAGTYHATGLASETSYGVEVRAVDAAEATGDVFKTRTVREDPLSRGWAYDPTADYGTAFDLVVDALGGGDHTTVSAAITAAADGDTIGIRAGTYREKADMPAGKSLTLSGYGQEKPTITAADLLTGLTAATSADLAVLGPALGVDGSPVYKTTLATSDAEHGGYGAELNLYEAGRRMGIATDRADLTDLFVSKDQSTFHVADDFPLDGSNRILRIEDASVINATNYTDAGLVGAKVLIYGNPNEVNEVEITAADVASNEITIDGLITVQGDTSSPDADDLRYSITNVAQALSPGTFFTEESGGTITVYVYPYDAANVGDIEFSARAHCIEVDNTLDDWTIRGLRVAQASGNSGALSEGINIFSANSGSGAFASGGTVENVLSSGTACTGSNSRGIYLQRFDDITVTGCTFYENQGQHGLGRSVRADQTRNTGWLVEKSSFTRSGAGIMSGFYFDHLAVADCYWDDAGTDAHASLSNFYGVNNLSSPNVGNDHLLFWNIHGGPLLSGAINVQRTSNVFFGFCEGPIYSKEGSDRRVINDDNQLVTGVSDYSAPEENGLFAVINCNIPPQFNDENTSNAAAIALGATSEAANGMRHLIANCVVHGMEEPADMPNSSISDVSHNIYSRFATGQSTADFDFTNDYESDPDVIWEDYANKDYAPAAGSPILSTPGKDMRALHDTLIAEFPQATITHDNQGNLIDWDDLPMGHNAGLTWVRDDPSLTEPTLASIATTTVSFSVTTDTDEEIRFAIYPEASPPADLAALQAGTGATATGTVAAPGIGIETFAATGLTAGTTYRAWAEQGDSVTMSEPFDTLAITFAVEGVDLFANSDSENATPYPAASFAPDADADDMLFVAALHDSDDVSMTATWRAVSATSLLQLDISGAGRPNPVGVFTAAPGSGAGDFIVTPAGESNALTVAAIGLASADVSALVQGVGVGDNSTAATDISGTLTGVTAGNIVIAVTITTGGTLPITAGASMDAGFGAITEITSTTSPSTSISNMSMAVTHMVAASTGDVTAEFDYSPAVQSSVVLLEFEPV